MDFRSKIAYVMFKACFGLLIDFTVMVNCYDNSILTVRYIQSECKPYPPYCEAQILLYVCNSRERQNSIYFNRLVKGQTFVKQISKLFCWTKGRLVVVKYMSFIHLLCTLLPAPMLNFVALWLSGRDIF